MKIETGAYVLWELPVFLLVLVVLLIFGDPISLMWALALACWVGNGIKFERKQKETTL